MRPNLDAMVMRFLPDTVIGKVAASMGVDSAPLKSAIETMVPRIIDILAKRTSSTSGAREVADVLASRNLEQLGKLAGSLGGAEQNDAARQGGKLAAELLAGTERETLSKQVADLTGIGAGQSDTLLNLLMPVVAGTLIHQQRQDNLDAAGLAGLLSVATGHGTTAEMGEPRPAPVRPFASPPEDTPHEDTPPPPPAAEPTPSRLSNAIPNVARIEKRELSPPAPSKDPVGIVTPPARMTETSAAPDVAAAEEAAKTLKQTRSILDVIRAGKREAEEGADSATEDGPPPPASAAGDRAAAPEALPSAADTAATGEPAAAKKSEAAVAPPAPVAKVVRAEQSPDVPAPKTRTVPPPPAVRRPTTQAPSRGWVRWGWVMPLVLMVATSAIWLPYLYQWTNMPEEAATARNTAAAPVSPQVQSAPPAAAKPSEPAPAMPKQAELTASPPAAAQKPADTAPIAAEPKAAAPTASVADDGAAAARKAEAEAAQRAAREKAAADAAAAAQRDAAAKAQEEAAARAKQEAAARAKRDEAAAQAEAARKAETAKLAEAARKAETAKLAEAARTPPTPSQPPPSAVAQPPKTAGTAPSGPAQPSTPSRTMSATADPQAYCRQVVEETSKANKIHFEFASPRLMSGDIPVLKALVAALKQCPTVKILVAGHTDSDGHFDRNQRLSDNRADAIIDFLSRNGIDDDRLKSIGYGQTRPLVPNTTAANKILNRRIEFSVIN